MHRNPHVVLRKINNCPYLIPFGQGISQGLAAVKINESGEFVWNYFSAQSADCPKQYIMDEPADGLIDQLINDFSRYYNLDKKEKEKIATDLFYFINQLIKKNLLIDSKNFNTNPRTFNGYNIDGLDKINKTNQLNYINVSKSSVCSQLTLEYNPLIIQIAEINLSIWGNRSLLLKELLAFETKNQCKENEKTMDIEISQLEKDTLDFSISLNPVLSDPLISIGEDLNNYHISFKQNHNLHRGIFSKDGKRVKLFYDVKDLSELKNEIFFALNHSFLYRAQKESIVMLHSASILYKDKLWLFSAASGTGKSTHTALWEKKYGVKTINGDLNLIALKNNKLIVYGSPWCGTSGKYDTKTYELGGIILLEQDKENYIQELSLDQKIIQINQRLISPNWTESQLDINLEITTNMISKILVCRLHCTKEVKAADVMKNRIDQYL